MEDLTVLVFLIAFPVLGVMGALWFWQLSKFFTWLRTHHPAEFKAMGEPSVFRNSTPSNNMSLLSFIMSDRASELGDETLIQWCRFLRKFFYIYLTLLIGLILVLVAGVTLPS
jgi:hypothetical protein